VCGLADAAAPLAAIDTGKPSGCFPEPYRVRERRKEDLRVIHHIAAAAALSFAIPQIATASEGLEYAPVSHCWEVPRHLHALLIGVDMIFIARLADHRSAESGTHDIGTFEVLDVLKGSPPVSFAYPAAVIADSDADAIAAVLERAAGHSEPDFLAHGAMRFPNNGDFEAVNLTASRPGRPVLEEGSCVRAPTVAAGVRYLMMFDDAKIVSIEPIADPSDYWLRLIKALQTNHYFPVYLDEPSEGPR
jgi:hypothetical protein